MEILIIPVPKLSYCRWSPVFICCLRSIGVLPRCLQLISLCPYCIYCDQLILYQFYIDHFRIDWFFNFAWFFFLVLLFFFFCKKVACLWMSLQLLVCVNVILKNSTLAMKDCVFGKKIPVLHSLCYECECLIFYVSSIVPNQHRFFNSHIELMQLPMMGYESCVIISLCTYYYIILCWIIVIVKYKVISEFNFYKVTDFLIRG